MATPRLCAAVQLVGSVLLAAACSDAGGDHQGSVHVQVTVAPPTTVAVATPFDVSWEVHNDTDDELHHTEIRFCPGADVADCGLGEPGSYTSATGTDDNGVHTASVSLDTAGPFTVVAWCHVGEDPHVSDAYFVDAT